MRWVNRYKLRYRRQRWRYRAWRKARQLHSVADRTELIRQGNLLVFSTLRNENIRLPYFLDYYRQRGAKHFLIVDNDSTDGSREYLASQPDCSVWHTTDSYKRSRFGVDWLNHLLANYGVGHWCLVVDPDEFLVYPHCDTRPIPALTDWLDSQSQRRFSAMLLDMYGDDRIETAKYQSGMDPMEILQYFDAHNYFHTKNHWHQNLWIQGGPRLRLFFSDDPVRAPALNKIPLVKWRREMVYHSSTHSMLPRGLNKAYAEWGGERACGILLHAKFLDIFAAKAAEEQARQQHYSRGREYRAYREMFASGIALWTPNSTRYEGWQQLEDIGLMSRGGWA